MKLIAIILCATFIPGSLLCQHSQLMLGCDRLLGSELSIVRDKRVGMVTNQSGRLSNGTFLIDTLIARGVKVVALFGPEHGIRGEAEAGQEVGDSRDVKKDLPVYSLYGAITKPSREMLFGVDILLYDIQDVGVRYYTYLSTMTLAMEAAAEAGIPFIVCDRPNPLGGLWIDGPIREDSLKSFVGFLPIPIIYGLTCGELASMVNNEQWLAGKIRADLHVIRMEGWTRDKRWDDIGLPWSPPSPNIRSFDASLLYPGTCLFEATNISEGRGTTQPFQVIGGPFVDGVKLCKLMTGLNLRGVRFSPATFTPTSSKFVGQQCGGVRIEVTDKSSIDPLGLAFELIRGLLALNPNDVVIHAKSFNRLSGTVRILQLLRGGENFATVKNAWVAEVDQFRLISRKYWLYATR